MARGAMVPPLGEKWMATFLLMPRAERLDDPDWEASLHAGPCTVAAPDETAARRYADSAFCLAVVEARPGRRPLASPWSQPRLVRARRIHEDRPGDATGEVRVPVGRQDDDAAAAAGAGGGRDDLPRPADRRL